MGTNPKKGSPGEKMYFYIFTVARWGLSPKHISDFSVKDLGKTEPETHFMIHALSKYFLNNKKSYCRLFMIV
jgi:hypothetical protein